MPRKKGWKKSVARKSVMEHKSGKCTTDSSTQHPVTVQSPTSPVTTQTEQSPVIAQAQQSPVILQAPRSPVIAQAQRSPVIAQAQQSPVIAQAQRSPVIAQAQRSPVIAQAQRSPVIAQAQQSPVIAQANAKHKAKREIFRETNKYEINKKNKTEIQNHYNTYTHDDKLVTDISENCKGEEKECEGDLQTSIVCNADLPQSNPSEIFNGKSNSRFETILHGSHHQGDSRFSIFSRSNQCTMNSLTALIYSHFSNLSTTLKLDEVLSVGDQLYKRVIENLKQNGRFKHRLLCLDEIPHSVDILSRRVLLQKMDIVSGLTLDTQNDSVLPTLHSALNSILQNQQYVLVVVGAICSAVFKKDNRLWLFDSHSHGTNGLSTFDGKSILMSFSNIDQLVAFIYSMYESMNIDLSCQYELLPLSFTEEDENQRMKDYFKDQLERSEARNKSRQNRCEYYRDYKRGRRNDPSFKQKEKVMQNRSRARTRANPAYKKKEKLIQIKSKAQARSDPEFKKKEKLIQERYHDRTRSDLEFKKKEKLIQNRSKAQARSDPENKKKEKLIQNRSKSQARSDPENKKKEKLIQNRSKAQARSDPENKKKEKLIQNRSKAQARSDPENKKKEKLIQNRSKAQARSDPENKKKEKLIQNRSKAKARSDPENKKKEKLIQNRSKAKVRSDPNFKEREKPKSIKSKRKARSNPLVLEKERLMKQSARFEKRTKMKELNSDMARKQLKRKNEEFREKETATHKKMKYGENIDSCIGIFHESIKQGPQFICTCCNQTWFKESVSKASNLTLDSKFFTGKKSIDEEEWICITCKRSLMNKKVPKLSVMNGMKFPDKPSELNLYPLEERLVSLRIPFMQVRELPRGRQYSVKGNIVNVPVDIQPVVNALPRPLDENVTIAVKLKKKLSFKSCAFTENVRPLRVLLALHWLKENSILYNTSSVKIDENWVSQVTTANDEISREFINPSERSPIKCEIKDSNCTKSVDSENVDQDSFYDSDTEENSQENVGNIDTLVDNADLENRINTLTFAPGEGQRPLSIYQDKDSEYLCFPTIFCGQRRKENAESLVSVSYGDIAKWELRSYDRRAANSVPNIFFKLKKYQMKQLNDKVNLAVRRCQLKGEKLTAEQARDTNYMENMVKQDEGYYIFKQLRNSPAYLEAKKKDVFAMIRQLGLPTWFMSLSSADTRWFDLLKMLSNLNDGTVLSDEQIANMTWEQKVKLIQKDPVTCSRYFDHRVQQFINIILKSSHDCLGELTDYFYRVEFQQRGSPHIHMLVWVKNAPKYKDSSNKEITEFVDEYLQCDSDNVSIQDLVQLQVHKHSRTCHKKADRICRFGYPLPPLKSTIILEPLESEVDKYKKMYEKLQKKINAEKDGFDCTYEQFLCEVLEISEEEYIKSIRSSLKAPKVFMKRTPKDIRLNLYNKTVLKAWKANIDIQFVLDPYACAMYIVSYISKSQRGMSSLLYAAAKEARNGNLDIKRQVRHIGNVFSNCVEVSAQEAVYLVLQMPLTRSTRDVVFVNTSAPNQRIQLLKTKSKLDELPKSSTDVVADNVIQRYSRRPKCLENWCLADYVSQLEVIYPKDSGTDDCAEPDRNDDDCDILITNEKSDEEQILIELKNGITIRKRKNHKVIRYVRFNKKTNEENHFREKILLFQPWRNEEKDLLANHSSYKEHYLARKNEIDMRCKVYEHHVEELEMACQAAENDCDAYDEIAPSTQQAEADAEAETPSEAESFIYFNPDRAVEHRQYDIGIELGNPSSLSSIGVTENLLPDENYRELIRCLNQKQKHFYNHVIHWLKTNDAPLYAFLTGGAGVGKSVVIKALYQTLYRYLNLSEGQNPDEKRVLLCAYTGKAAYNINGSTISTAFHQKFKQKEQTLNCDTLNTFRSKYRNLSVVIIDEISMVSNSILQFIDQRLQELTGTQLPFGGKSIIAVGDLYQLKPVAGSWIFEDLRNDASALCPNLWQNHFKMFELTEIMRQQDGSAFAELLNRLRMNQMTEEDKKQLEHCRVHPDSANYPINAPHIFAENSFMQDFNNKIMNKTDTQKVEIQCHDTVIGANISKKNQENVLSRLASDTYLSMGLHSSLTVVVDMIYDLTINIDTEDGLTNGSSCVVKKVENKQNDTTRPSIIWVQFDDDKIGNERRNKYYNRGFYHDSIDRNWVPIFDTERTFQYRQNTIQRIQFPLQPAAGRTVHRAQGTTLDEVVIDLSQRRIRKNPHIHYVALSRVRSIDKLSILNFNEKSLSMDERVSEEMKRLRSESMLSLCYTPLDIINSDDHFKIIYNNCRSLHKHFEDILKDKNILSSHVIGLSETRLVQADCSLQYAIPGFKLIRNDQVQRKESVRPSHGLAMYIKEGLNLKHQFCYSEQNFEFISITTKCFETEKQIVVVYKSPKLPLHRLLALIRKEVTKHIDAEKPLVIIGDFNIDVSKSNGQLEETMEQIFHCQQLICQPTTDHGSTLDLIFSNRAGNSGTIQSYWSDHSMVYFYT